MNQWLNGLTVPQTASNFQLFIPIHNSSKIFNLPPTFSWGLPYPLQLPSAITIWISWSGEGFKLRIAAKNSDLATLGSFPSSVQDSAGSPQYQSVPNQTWCIRPIRDFTALVPGLCCLNTTFTLPILGKMWVLHYTTLCDLSMSVYYTTLHYTTWIPG